jgi:hypothetical protein
MASKARKIEPPAKHGRFLLSRRTFRTNVLIYFLTWTSLVLILCAVLFQREWNSAMWWVVLVTFFNTIAVGLSHRELLRLTIQQEMEIIANSKARGLDGQMNKETSAIQSFSGGTNREDLIPH